ncbi:MAG: type II toxin-antitoxin system VapC family toxin [Rhabdochlamydiaceae bacterium]
MIILLDTNIFVYYLVPPEYLLPADRTRWSELHDKAKIIYENILAGKHTLVVPAIILVEIASIIQSITGDESKAAQAIEEIKRLNQEGIANILYLDSLLTEQSVSFVIESKLKSVDAIIGTCSVIRQATLVTNDADLYLAIINIPAEPGVSDRIDAYLLRAVSIDQLNELFDP